MPDVPLYTAVISGCAAVVGAAVPTFSALLQTSFQAKRDRRDRFEMDERQACVELLQAVENLRAQIAGNHEYHGDEMGARLMRVRAYAADARVQALRISLLAPPGLARPAGELAAAATRLEQAAEATTDVDAGISSQLPGFSELEDPIDAFKAAAVSGARTTGKKGAASRPYDTS